MTPPKELNVQNRRAGKIKPLTGNQFDRWTSQVDDALSREKVVDALKHFKVTYEKLLEERKGEKKGKMTHRVDVLASNALKKEDRWVNCDEEVGRVPGVHIGDQFQFRAEMLVVGLHKHHINGICYVRIFDKCFATSVVNSVRYYNNERLSDSEFEYVGQGGNPKVSKTKAKDQHLTNGNLALKTNMEEKFPVRVIHYLECDKSDEGGKYIYDGLYFVSSYKKERGDLGKMVFKFRMIKIANQ